MSQDTYTSSNGKIWQIAEMPFPYLMNAKAKAEAQGQAELAKRLDEEIELRKQAQ